LAEYSAGLNGGSFVAGGFFRGSYIQPPYPGAGPRSDAADKIRSNAIAACWTTFTKAPGLRAFAVCKSRAAS